MAISTVSTDDIKMISDQFVNGTYSDIDNIHPYMKMGMISSSVITGVLKEVCTQKRSDIFEIICSQMSPFIIAESIWSLIMAGVNIFPINHHRVLMDCVINRMLHEANKTVLLGLIFAHTSCFNLKNEIYLTAARMGSLDIVKTLLPYVTGQDELGNSIRYFETDFLLINQILGRLVSIGASTQYINMWVTSAMDIFLTSKKTREVQWPVVDMLISIMLAGGKKKRVEELLFCQLSFAISDHDKQSLEKTLSLLVSIKCGSESIENNRRICLSHSVKCGDTALMSNLVLHFSVVSEYKQLIAIELESILEEEKSSLRTDMATILSGRVYYIKTLQT